MQIKNVKSIQPSGANIVVVATTRRNNVDTDMTYTFSKADVEKNGVSKLLGAVDLSFVAVPASAVAAGAAGEIAMDANFLYLCVATNTWRRVAIAAW